MVGQKKMLWLLTIALFAGNLDASSRGGSKKKKSSGARSSSKKKKSSGSRGGSKGASTPAPQQQQAAQMVAADYKLYVQPGDAATDQITDASTVDPLLLMNASITTREPMAQAAINTLVESQIKPFAQFVQESKTALQAGPLSADQIAGLKGRIIQLMSTAPVTIRVPAAANVITDARIISGQTNIGAATIPVTLADLDANKYTNSQVANIVVVSRKGITGTQLDDIKVIRWNQKLKPLVDAAKAAPANSAIAPALTTGLKDILSTGWADAYVEATVAETVLAGQSFLADATVPLKDVTAINGAFDDQLAKLVVKSVANLSQTQFNAIKTQVDTNITPNLNNPANLKANLAALVATNQVIIMVAPHVEAIVQEPTVAETVLVGQSFLADATVQLTDTAAINGAFDDQLAKLVIKSVANLSQTPFNSVKNQVDANIIPNLNNPAALKANLPAILATNQVVIMVAPHVEAPALITTAQPLFGPTTIDGLLLVSADQIDALTGDQVAGMALFSKPNITQADLTTLQQEIVAKNIAGGASIAAVNSAAATQTKNTIKSMLTQGATAGKADLYVPAAAAPAPTVTTPAGDNVLAQIQAIVIPGESVTSTDKLNDATLATLLAKKITVTTRPGATDTNNYVGQITATQNTLNAYYFNADGSLKFATAVSDLSKIKAWLIAGLTENVLNVTILP